MLLPQQVLDLHCIDVTRVRGEKLTAINKIVDAMETGTSSVCKEGSEDGSIMKSRDTFQFRAYITKIKVLVVELFCR